MPRETSTVRAVGKYVVALLSSLFVASLAVVPFDQPPEPGSLPRLVGVLVFFSVFTLLFLWDAGYLSS